jgi:ABC-type glycerol-3-phosphate transport system permease component
MAGSTVAVIPLILVLQRYILSGLTLGSARG